jgi:hypothetical protein
MTRPFKPGDWVIYRKQKVSVHPGRHARDIHPAPNGDSYTYCVPKLYRVVAVQPARVVVRTRRGRHRILAAGDPGLRRAHWWEWLLLWDRFPTWAPADEGAPVPPCPGGDGSGGNGRLLGS